MRRLDLEKASDLVRFFMVIIVARGNKERLLRQSRAMLRGRRPSVMRGLEVGKFQCWSGWDGEFMLVRMSWTRIHDDKSRLEHAGGKLSKGRPCVAAVRQPCTARVDICCSSALWVFVAPQPRGSDRIERGLRFCGLMNHDRVPKLVFRGASRSPLVISPTFTP